MRVAGVDPGLDGAIAVLDEERHLEVFDVPTMKARSRGREINLPALKQIVFGSIVVPIKAVFIERNSSRPNEGSAAGRKGGLVEGVLLGAFAMHDTKVNRVPPGVWKKRMRLTRDKEYSRTRAIEEFPEYHELFKLKKHHNRAEAALLALYGLEELQIELPPRRRPRPRLSDVL